LRYPYELRDASAYFEDIADFKVPAEMLKLAGHILDSDFDPSTFVDHYDAGPAAIAVEVFGQPFPPSICIG